MHDAVLCGCESPRIGTALPEGIHHCRPAITWREGEGGQSHCPHAKSPQWNPGHEAIHTCVVHLVSPLHLRSIKILAVVLVFYCLWCHCSYSLSFSHTYKPSTQVHHYQPRLPSVDVKCDECPVIVGKVTRVKILFRNPLSRSLSRLLFLVQAQGLCAQRELSYRRGRYVIY